MLGLGAEPVGDVDHRRGPGRRQRPARGRPAARVELAARSLPLDAIGDARSRSSGCSSSISPAAAPPNYPVTQTANPGSAPERPTICSAESACPTAVTQTARIPAAVRSPPSTATPSRSASSARPSQSSRQSCATEILGHPEPDVGLGRTRPHRGEIAERRPDRLAADRARRTPAAAEARAFDQRVDADARWRGAGARGDRGVVADPDRGRRSRPGRRSPRIARGSRAIRSNSGERRIAARRRSLIRAPR